MNHVDLIRKTGFTMGIEKSTDDQEDQFESRLSPELCQLALTTLKEDEKSKKEALKDFRSWIRSNKDIKNCRLDSNFLLRFLRMQKFDLKEARNILEKYLTMRCQYPMWFQNLDYQDSALSELVDLGYIFVLPERDSHGRRVIFSQAAAMDPGRFSASDIMRAHIMTFETLLQDEENQIRGFTYVFDEKSVSWSQLAIWTPSQVSKAFSCCEGALPMRHQEIHFLNLPWTMSLIFSFAKSLLSEKIRNRFQTHSGIESLTESVPTSILPKEYGGTVTMAECIKSWKVELRGQNRAVKDLDKMQMNLYGEHQAVSRKKSRQNSGSGIMEVVGNMRRLDT